MEKNKSETKNEKPKSGKKTIEAETEPVPEKTDGLLPEKLAQTITGLSYTSETDCGFETVIWKPESGAEAFASVDAVIVLRLAGKPPETEIKEIAFGDFFAKLTAAQDWYGDEEKATVRRYQNLQNLLAENLRDPKVFKVGAIEIDIYIVGVDQAGNIAGVKTKAVET